MPMTVLALPLAAFVALGTAPDASFVLQGRVLDPTRAPILAASVTAVPKDQRSRPTTKTDTNGEFRLALPRGSYTLEVAVPGFSPVSEPLQALGPGGDPREIVLKVAPLRRVGHRARFRRLRGRVDHAAPRRP